MGRRKRKKPCGESYEAQLALAMGRGEYARAAELLFGFNLLRPGTLEELSAQASARGDADRWAGAIGPYIRRSEERRLLRCGPDVLRDREFEGETGQGLQALAAHLANHLRAVARFGYYPKPCDLLAGADTWAQLAYRCVKSQYLSKAKKGCVGTMIYGFAEVDVCLPCDGSVRLYKLACKSGPVGEYLRSDNPKRYELRALMFSACLESQRVGHLPLSRTASTLADGAHVWVHDSADDARGLLLKVDHHYADRWAGE